MRIVLAALVVIALVFVGAALLARSPDRGRQTRTTPGSNQGASGRVAAPPLTATEVNRQDPPEAQRQRAEARAFDRRPLLNALPTTVHGIDFDIRGLDGDGHTTILVANRNGQRRQQVRVAYDALLRRTGDRSGSYRLVVRP